MVFKTYVLSNTEVLDIHVSFPGCKFFLKKSWWPSSQTRRRTLPDGLTGDENVFCVIGPAETADGTGGRWVDAAWETQRDVVWMICLTENTFFKPGYIHIFVYILKYWNVSISLYVYTRYRYVNIYEFHYIYIHIYNYMYIVSYFSTNTCVYIV